LIPGKRPQLTHSGGLDSNYIGIKALEGRYLAYPDENKDLTKKDRGEGRTVGGWYGTGTYLTY
jgi:hypothetical protein